MKNWKNTNTYQESSKSIEHDDDSEVQGTIPNTGGNEDLLKD